MPPVDNWRYAFSLLAIACFHPGVLEDEAGRVWLRRLVRTLVNDSAIENSTDFKLAASDLARCARGEKFDDFEMTTGLPTDGPIQ